MAVFYAKKWECGSCEYFEYSGSDLKRGTCKKHPEWQAPYHDDKGCKDWDEARDWHPSDEHRPY